MHDAETACPWRPVRSKEAIQAARCKQFCVDPLERARFVWIQLALSGVQPRNWGQAIGNPRVTHDWFMRFSPYSHSVGSPISLDPGLAWSRRSQAPLSRAAHRLC